MTLSDTVDGRPQRSPTTRLRAGSDPLAARVRAVLGDAYELEGLLGRGGMGAVYKATHRALRRRHAIKVLTDEMAWSEELHERLLAEARTVGSLSHPHIVSVFDAGEHDGLVWFAMALIEGESLRDRVKRAGPLPPPLARRVLQELAQALAYAHARGVVHRDVKPENILIETETRRALLTDFGLARSAGSLHLTQSGTVLGTPTYMAPEQATGRPADAQADMYALGLVGFFMLTGRDAIQGQSVPEIISWHLQGKRVDLAALNGKAPTGLTEAIRRCLEPVPAERYERMEQFIEALEALGDAPRETPAVIRSFLRVTDWTWMTLTFTALALGVAGHNNVRPLFAALIAGLPIFQWLSAYGNVRQRGFTWPAVRRAMVLEGNRQFEEMHEAQLSHASLSRSPVLMIVTVLFLPALLAIELLERKGPSSLLDLLFLGVGVLGLLGWSPRATLTVALNRPSRGSYFMSLPFLGGLGLLAALMIAVPRAHDPHVRDQLSGAVAGVFSVIVLGFVLHMRRKKSPSPHVTTAKDWRPSRFIDLVGSVLFGRFVRHGRLLRFERDRVEPEGDPSGAPAATTGLEPLSLR